MPLFTIIILAVIFVPMTVRIVTGSDKLAVLSIVAVIGYLAHYAGKI